MISYDGFQYFVIFMNAHMKYIWFFFLWLQNPMFLQKNFINFKLNLNPSSL